MHQREQLVARQLRVGVNADGPAVLCPQHQLFPEISEQIGNQTGISLGPVVGGGSLRQQHDAVDVVNNHSPMFSV